ncbi:FimV/HubP family polar landmark protein [Chromobacterium alticapitis]|nr:FimV/HubP family polar landmark protein [Chromobacterium alticapitis]
MTGLVPGEMDAVRVGLASMETFQALNVDYASALSTLRFALNPGAKGATIRVSSTRPINDPYLRFVVEAKAPSGRSVREYTVLLDPANYTPGGQSIVQDAPSYADSDQASRYKAAPAAKPAQAAPAELRVKQGATLRALAQKVKPRGASLRQAMAALALANPDAFDPADINHPKAGSVLTVPSPRKIKAVTAEQASSILGPLPSAPAAAPSQPQAMQPAGKGGDVLKLAPGDAGDSVKLNDLQQQINAREKALQDATARIAALEQQLKALQTAGLLPPAKIASAPAAAPMPASAAQALKPVELARPVVKHKPAHVAPPPPPPQPSLMARIMDYLPLIGGGVAVTGLLGLLGIMVARRRKSAGLDASGSATLGRATVTGHGPNTVAGSHSFMSNFTQAAGAIDAAEVDPVAEAEVYIAYGRDQQAEEILKDALLKDPSRHEVRMKLMEVYAARPDTANFERLAREMQAAFDGRGVMWAKTVTLGRAIDPDNPLYQSGEESMPALSGAARGDDLIDLDKELFGEEGSMIEAEPLSEAASAVEMEEADPLAALFDLPTEAPAKPAEPNVLDFDLESMLPEEPAAAAPPPVPADGNLLDFDFNLDSALVEEAKPVEESAGGLESLYADMMAETPQPASAAAPQAEGMSVLDDPLSTKLDLAKVYLDMGDREGAREVLQDLLSEAQGSLKDEAQALFDKISV